MKRWRARSRSMRPAPPRHSAHGLFQRPAAAADPFHADLLAGQGRRQHDHHRPLRRRRHSLQLQVRLGAPARPDPPALPRPPARLGDHHPAVRWRLQSSPWASPIPRSTPGGRRWPPWSSPFSPPARTSSSMPIASRYCRRKSRARVRRRPRSAIASACWRRARVHLPFPISSPGTGSSSCWRRLSSVGMFAFLIAPEPEVAATPPSAKPSPTGSQRSVVAPFTDFIERRGWA